MDKQQLEVEVKDLLEIALSAGLDVEIERAEIERVRTRYDDLQFEVNDESDKRPD